MINIHIKSVLDRYRDEVRLNWLMLIVIPGYLGSFINDFKFLVMQGVINLNVKNY